jgi:hypothetical protein
LLEHLGLNQQLIADEVRALLPALLRNAHATGLLERCLEPRLRAFYSSKACAKLLP